MPDDSRMRIGLFATCLGGVVPGWRVGDVLIVES